MLPVVLLISSLLPLLMHVKSFSLRCPVPLRKLVGSLLLFLCMRLGTPDATATSWVSVVADAAGVPSCLQRNNTDKPTTPHIVWSSNCMDYRGTETGEQQKEAKAVN